MTHAKICALFKILLIFKIEIGFSIDVWKTTSLSKPKLIIFEIWNGKPKEKMFVTVPTILMHHDAFIGKVN